MRILHIVPYYPPDRKGGVGEFVARVHRELVDRGLDTTVWTPGNSPEPGVERISKTGMGWFFNLATRRRQLKRYDILHLHGGECLPALLAARSLKQRPASLLTMHVHYAGMADALKPVNIASTTFCPSISEKMERLLLCPGHRMLDYLALRLCDTTNAVCADTARRFGLAQDQVVRAGLESSASSRPAQAPTDLLYVGPASWRKRAFLLPLILEAVRRRVSEARLRIVGFSLADTPNLRAQFEERGLLPHVEAVGALSAEDVAAHYRAARVLVFPSAYEGLPLTIVEAMREGLAVVATRVSGNPEALKDRETGMLVSPDAPALLADQCVALLQDTALRDRLGKAARDAVAADFNIVDQVDAYVHIYEQILQKRNGDTRE